MSETRFPRLPGRPQDDDVGYGKPPTASRFKKGQSGNPRGRPKGATARTPARRLKHLTRIVLEEAARPITVHDGGRTRTMPMAQVVIRRLAIAAAEGDARAQRLYLETVALSEAEVQRVAMATPARQPPRMEIVIVDPKAPQADDDAEKGSGGSGE